MSSFMTLIINVLGINFNMEFTNVIYSIKCVRKRILETSVQLVEKLVFNDYKCLSLNGCYDMDLGWIWLAGRLPPTRPPETAIHGVLFENWHAQS